MKKTLFSIALTIAAVCASAQTIRYEVQTRSGVPVAGIALQTTQSACDTVIRPLVGQYHCHRVTIGSGTTPTPVVCPPAPAASSTSTSTSCPANHTGGPIITTVTDTYSVGAPNACTVSSSRTSSTSGVCTPATTPPPPTPNGLVYYFSDCQAGAATGCVPGSNSNPGTLAQPKQNLAGLNLSMLPAGTDLLFKRGGSWNHSTQRLSRPVDVSGRALNANPPTAAAPLRLDAYGDGPQPIFRTASGHAFETNVWTDTPPPATTPAVGNLMIRNIKFDGLNTAEWGFWFRGAVDNVILENNTFTGFRIALNSQNGHPVRNITIRNNLIERNRAMGILGHWKSTVIEGNTFRANNFGGSNFDHATYIGGGENITVRNNVYDRNSVVNSTCTGGNMTFHGQIDGLLIEGNEIIQDAGTSTCYGVSITRGYTTAEWFRNTVVRNNKVMNVGTGIVAQSAPGIVVEGNVAINTNINIGSGPNAGTGGDSGDVGDTGAVVRNNTICRRTGSGGVTVNSQGATFVNNVVLTDAAATSGVCAR